MEARCHRCGGVNLLSPDVAAQGRFVCTHCGAVNMLPVPRGGEDTLYNVGGDSEATSYGGMGGGNEATRYDTGVGQQGRGGYNGGYQGGSAPQGGYRQPVPPMPRQGGSAATTWIIVALVAVVVALGVWAFVSSRSDGKSNEDVELVDSQDNEQFIRDFYRECVFGNPRVSDIEKACTRHMLDEISEGDNRYALYKFATSHSKGKSDESRVKDVVEVKSGVYRVDYIDRGYEGSSNVYMAKTDDGWKIDRVEFLSEEKAEEPKAEKIVTVHTDTYNYQGYVKDPEYSVTGKLTYTPDGTGYKISGKYAYYSTLRNYGDKATSWINVTGRVEADGSFYWDEWIKGNSEHHSHVTGTISRDFSSINGYNGSGTYHEFNFSN